MNGDLSGVCHEETLLWATLLPGGRIVNYKPKEEIKGNSFYIFYIDVKPFSLQWCWLEPGLMEYIQLIL